MMSRDARAIAVLGMLTLAPLTQAGPLIGGNVTPDAIYVIDKDTADVALIADLTNDAVAQGLAYDFNADLLYAVDAGADAVWEVDPDTGDASVVAFLSFTNANALAFDPNTGLLYGADNATNQLFSVDPDTGAVDDLNVFTGASFVEGLAWDSATDTLFGLADGEDLLVTIDPVTSVATPVLKLGGGNWRGLGYDAELDALFASTAALGSLFHIDLDAGVPQGLVAIGAIALPADALQGLAVRCPPAGDDCPADCNNDGNLNVLDFTCFQGLFAAQDQGADCNGDSAFNILDFTCFQAQFATGCP